ncbi:MAG: hypothetical protein K0Q62_1340, partial [Phenylobacterium sp.]|nr:hypothetical protein [Phenylobacterium sp.]
MSLTPTLAGAHAPRHPAWSSAIIGVLAVGAWFIGKVTGFPAPVLAAAAGMCLGLAGVSGRMAAGLTWWARPGLKVGVALLGAQIAWAELA